jgi:hypothetical protein
MSSKPKTPEEDAVSMIEIAFDELVPKLRTTVEIARRTGMLGIIEQAEAAEKALSEAQSILKAHR